MTVRIEVLGGAVQSVTADETDTVEVEIIDYDNGDCSCESLDEVPHSHETYVFAAEEDR